MFSQDLPMRVTLKSIYGICRFPLEHATATNMNRCTPHSFKFTLNDQQGCMTVDDVPESRAEFRFSEDTNGYFSLASNSIAGQQGAFRYIRLKVGGSTVLDIDFKDLHSVDELEDYFNCYYFPYPDCNGKGRAAQIKNFWSLNERGHLVCACSLSGRIPFGDKGPFCLLTLRNGPIGDFEAEVGFEQCWRRYGIVFGCDKQAFPYYWLLNSWKTVSVRGALAFADSHDGACFVRGALLDPSSQAPVPHISKSCPLVEARFLSAEQTTLPLHTLTYHFESKMTYHAGGQAMHATAGSVMYLPPDTPCRLEGEEDQIFRVEFESDQTFPPTLIQPKHPELVRRMFDELESIWCSNLPDRGYRAMSVFYRIMAELSQPSSDTAADTVRKILHYIHNHFTEPTLTVKEVAEAINLCESSFYHVFHTACGMTPKEYILNCRLQHACTLLKTQRYKIYEVAEKCGFSDTKYFMTAFKREMGISPGKYETQNS